MIKLGVKNCSRGGKLLPAFFFTRFYSYLLPQRGRQGERRAKSTTLPSRHRSKLRMPRHLPLHRGGSWDRAPKKDFAKQKIFWEKETQAERSSREKRSGGPQGFAATRRQGESGHRTMHSAATRRQGEKAERRCEQDEEREENLKELTGFPQRFCEAKDLREEGEQVLSCQRHGVALTTCELGSGALLAPLSDRARILSRETSRHQSLAPTKEGRARFALLRRAAGRQSIAAQMLCAFIYLCWFLISP